MTCETNPAEHWISLLAPLDSNRNKVRIEIVPTCRKQSSAINSNRNYFRPRPGSAERMFVAAIEANIKPARQPLGGLIATFTKLKNGLTAWNKGLTNFLTATKMASLEFKRPPCLRGQFPVGTLQPRLTPSESGCYIESFEPTGEFALRRCHSNWMISLAALALFACGCAVSKKTVVKPGEAPGPLMTATRADLIARYNAQAAAVTSLNATVSMKLTAGSAYTGVIEQYHEVNGFILASAPASIRVIGQAPVVGKNIFDMVSDGHTFHIFIPSKNKFLEGQANLERAAKKPIENLRPQHLVDALLWSPIAGDTPVLFEEDNEPASRYYVLTIISFPKMMVRAITTGVDPGWEIARKIWFSRSDLNVARIAIFASEGKVNSAAYYSGWQPAGAINYPRQVTISRPGDDYKLEIHIKKITLNETIAPDRFVLQQPPGTELVRVGEDSSETRTAEPKPTESNPKEPKQ